MQGYVCGLLFDQHITRVLLIRKNKPAWQKGLLNAVGGKIERGENAEQAMHREFEEEAGVNHIMWQLYATLTGKDFHISFFRAFSYMIDYARTQEEEELVIVPIDSLFSQPLIPNLRLFIPLAMDNTGIEKPVHLYDYIPEEVRVGNETSH